VISPSIASLLVSTEIESRRRCALLQARFEKVSAEAIQDVDSEAQGPIDNSLQIAK
jgi:hypothetical protein